MFVQKKYVFQEFIPFNLKESNTAVEGWNPNSQTEVNIDFSQWRENLAIMLNENKKLDT